MRPSARTAALVAAVVASLAFGAAATSRGVTHGDPGGEPVGSKDDAFGESWSLSRPTDGVETTAPSTSTSTRALLQFSGGCAPGRAGPINSADRDDLCTACQAGTFASGQEAYCIFPDVDVTCKPTFNSAVDGWNAILDPVFGDFTAALTIAARCDFGKDDPALLSGDQAQCHFAQLGQAASNPTTCVPSVSIDAEGTIVNTFTCSIDASDAIDAAVFETCINQGLTQGTTVQCVWGGDQTQCATCPAGSLCDSTNSIEPPPCPLGEACSDGATSTMCLEGTYAGGGFDTCLNCPNGTKCPDQGTGVPTLCLSTTYSGEGATACEECWAGHFCGGQGVEWPVPCDAGSYAVASSDSCALCNPGETSTAAADTCTDCPAGTMCPNSGTAIPVACDVGTAAVAGSALCISCVEGTYQGETSASECIDCPAGTSCAFTGMSSPTTCWAGAYSGYDVKDNAIAFALPYDETDTDRFPTNATTGSTQCLTCPSGYTCATVDAAPVLCPEGTTRLVAGGNWTHCTTCPAGYSCATPNVDPTACDPGYYTTGGAAECTACAAGYYCPSTDQDLLLRCASGYYALGGNATCTVCPAGTACSNADGTEMEICASGTFAEVGSTQCTPCPPGFSCPSTLTSSTMTSCVAGTYSAGGAAECVECPTGTFGTDTGAYSADLCSTCPAGTFSNNTGATSDTTCTACPADTYCVAAGTTLPTACPTGTGTFGETNVIDASACQQPSPPPPPPAPFPPPPSPPPPPLPPALAAEADSTPTMTLRLDGTPDTFDQDLFAAGVATAVGGGATTADVVVEDIRSGSVVVDFYVNVPGRLYPVALGGAWDVEEATRVVSTLNAAITTGSLATAIGATVLSNALESTCSPGSRIAATTAEGTKVCEICGVGTFSSDADATTCVPCAVGTAAGARGMTSCDTCAAGTVAQVEGTAVCAACVPGTIAPDEGSAVCDACDEFFFAATSGSTVCEPCPAGYLSGPTAWQAETARMRADGALSADVRAAVDRAGCLLNETAYIYVLNDDSQTEVGLLLSHVITAAATLVASVGGMVLLGYKQWARQRLLVKYAGGETFYEELLVPGSEGKDRNGEKGNSSKHEQEDLFGAVESIKAMVLDDAEQVLDLILKRNGKHAEAMHAKAIIHLLYGELDSAKQVNQKAMKLVTESPKNDSPMPHFLATAGVIETRLGDLLEATKWLERATRSDPTLAVAHYNLGLTKMKLNDYENAKESFTTALDKEPGYYKALYMLGLVEATIGRASDAKRWFKASVAAKHRALDSHFNLGMLYAREGDTAEAENCFNRCLAVHAKHAPSIVKLGNLHTNKGFPKRAVEKYLLALEIDPDNVEAICNIGVVEWSLEHAAEAEQHFLLALKFDKQYLPALYNMGLLCAEQGRVEEAASWYRRALATRPTSGRAQDSLFRLGTALRRLGELDGESPRRVEKTAREREIEAEEAAREAEEAEARAQEAVAAELRGEIDGRARRREERRSNEPKTFASDEDRHKNQNQMSTSGRIIPSGPTRDFIGSRRRCQRLMLISSAVKGVDMLTWCALNDIGVVTYDHSSATAGDILKKLKAKISDKDGLKKVDSIAILSPCGDGWCALSESLVLTQDSLLDADTSYFVQQLVNLVEKKENVNAFREGSRFDFLTLDASLPSNHSLAENVKSLFGINVVNASNDISRLESFAMTAEFIRTEPAAAGMRSAQAYFDLSRLEKWTLLPDVPASHAPPPEEIKADPVTRRVSTFRESKADIAAETSAAEVAANAARKLQTVGRTYAAYFRMRAIAKGDKTGEEEEEEKRNAEEAAAAAREKLFQNDKVSEKDDDSSLSETNSGLSSAAARVLGGIYTPASAVFDAGKIKQSNLKDGAKLERSSTPSKSPKKSKSKLKKAVHKINKIPKSSTATTERDRRSLSVDLLIEMSGDEFKELNTQRYFCSELSNELGARGDRFRVKMFDQTSGAATVLVDEAPGDVSLPDLVSSLRTKLDSDSLLIDPVFGAVVLSQVIWPEGWDNRGSKLTDNKKMGKQEEEVGDDSVEVPDELALSSVESSTSAQQPPTRLVLISSRVKFAETLVSSTKHGALAVYFDWRFGSLQALAHDCAVACGNLETFKGLKSIGLVTHHKPGAVGLVKGLRLTRRNLARAELRNFWLSLQKLLRPDGEIEMLAYDANTCSATRRLLEELEDLLRAPIRSTDTSAMANKGLLDDDDTVDEDSVSNTDTEPVKYINPASNYFKAKRFLAWATAAPEKYVLGSGKYFADNNNNRDAPVPYANTAGLPEGLADDSTVSKNQALAFKVDPHVDDSVAEATRVARAEQIKQEAEAKRLASMRRNPNDILKETTMAGGVEYDPMTLKPYESAMGSASTSASTSERRFQIELHRERFDADAERARVRRLVPKFAADKLAAARDESNAYDARLDTRAMETRERTQHRALLSDAALDAEERRARNEARVEDMSLVPTLRFGGDRGTASSMNTSRSVTHREKSKSPSRGALANVSNVWDPENDAPKESDFVNVHETSGVTSRRPQFVDEHLEKLRRYENTGLGGDRRE